MKFTIKTKVLLKHLKDVGSALASTSTIPILHGILFQVNSDNLVLTTSNADLSIVRKVNTDKKSGLKVSGTGSFVLAGKFLIKLVNEMPDDTITFESSKQSKHQIRIGSGHTVFSLNSMDASNYPHLPKLDHGTSLSLDGKTLDTIIDKTTFACANAENRPVLTGVHFNLSDGKLTVASTDAHRLSQYTTKLNGASTTSLDVTIPADNLNNLSSLLGDKDSVKLQSAGTQLLFKFDNTLFYSRSLEGNYPSTTHLISACENAQKSVGKTQIFVDTNYLADVTERASLISHSTHNNNVVLLDIDPSSKIAHISATGDDIGSDKEIIPVDKFTGKKIKISINPDYILDALKAIGNHKIVITFINPLRPATIVPLDDKGNPMTNFVQLLTPVRTF